LAEHRVDLVHVQGSANLANRVPKPRVLTIHGIPELDSLYRPRFPRTKSRVQRVIAGHARRNVENTIVISPYVRRLLEKDLRGRTWDIENPVSDSFFDAERGTTPGRVLYGGSICKRKNAAGLLRAFSQVARQREDAELRLAGAGADSPASLRFQCCRVPTLMPWASQNRRWLWPLRACSSTRRCHSSRLRRTRCLLGSFMACAPRSSKHAGHTTVTSASAEERSALTGYPLSATTATYYGCLACFVHH
jgi:glycosyltransferase involved in cell wall biosynthesis